MCKPLKPHFMNRDWFLVNWLAIVVDLNVSDYCEVACLDPHLDKVDKHWKHFKALLPHMNKTFPVREAKFFVRIAT